MYELGDVGGIVLNRRSEAAGWPKGSETALVSGNQRSSQLPADAKLTITQKFDPPTRAGTVALGWVDFEGEQFSYREVDWSEEREQAALVRANVPAGDWDEPALGRMLATMNERRTDLTLTGLEEERIAKLIASVAGVTRHEETAQTNRVGDVSYQVVVQCTSESAQGELLEELEKRGFKCRLLML